MNIKDLFWSSSIEELKNGFIEEEKAYICLFCGKTIEKGIVYPFEDVFYEAKRYMHVHISQEHGSVFECLLGMDKKITGLSDHQGELLRLFYQGKNDKEIQGLLGIGSSSTIRNHRFVLKEKERQAKIFLVLMELLKKAGTKPAGFTAQNRIAQIPGGHYIIGDEENEKILRKYFINGPEGQLKTFKMKEKSRLAVLRQIVRRFESERIYSEKEVNEILKNVYGDHIIIRRYLVDYGFLDRKPDGSEYWIKKGADEMKQNNLSQRKELIRQYKEIKTEAGVYQIKNIKNNKVFVASTPNLKTMNGKRMMLAGGTHKNRKLQEDWNIYGNESFVFETLEILKEKEYGYFNRAEELKALEQKWLEKIKPYGDLGYN